MNTRTPLAHGRSRWAGFSHRSLCCRERPKLLIDSTSREPTHIFTAVADMPPGACTKCAEKGRVGVCIMCKVTPPYDEGVYTMVRPLRLGKDG